MLSVHIKKQMAHFTIDVEFQARELVTALFGPSGSGKTTILECIAGLLPMDGGKIVLQNRVLTEHGERIIPVHQREIGYVFQDYALFPHKTVRENIRYGMKDKETTEQLIAELKVRPFLDRYPHEISGGEKQRTALIRALASKPSLLLLDEPFSALDEATKGQSMEQLARICANWNIPILLVTHNKSEVEKLAKDVIYLSEGKVSGCKHLH